jgi:hypothetical protein
MNYSTFCLQSHLYPGNGDFPGSCFYDNINDWYNYPTESNVKQEVKFTTDEGPTFGFTVNGSLISPPDQGILRDNIKSITIPPNVYMSLYANESCIGNSTTIIGKYVSKYTDRTGDFIDTGNIDGSIRCVEINTEIPWVDFISGCNDGSITGNMCGNFQPTTPGFPPDIDDDDKIPVYDDRLWIQIVGAILFAIVLILVGIAYYKAWKRYIAVKNVEKARVLNRLADYNTKRVPVTGSNVGYTYGEQKPPMNKPLVLRQESFESPSPRLPMSQPVGYRAGEAIGIDTVFQRESIGPLVPTTTPISSPRGNLGPGYGQQRFPMGQPPALRQESSSLRIPMSQPVSYKASEGRNIDNGFQRGPSISSSLTLPGKFPPSSSLILPPSANLASPVTIPGGPSATIFKPLLNPSTNDRSEVFSSFTGL